jgi:hypothetical protein
MMRQDRLFNVKVENLNSNAKVWELMARFNQPINQATRDYLEEEGLGDAATRAVGCMGWIWTQWLLRTADTEVRKQVKLFVERGMQMQKLSTKFHMRPRHDLFLLHCAIFAGEEAQLLSLAKEVVDGSGYGSYKPCNNGELYLSAWTGMLKYWILGDEARAVEQSNIIWGATRDTSLRASTKELVIPWLQKDWKTFLKRQEKEFEKLWARAGKDGTLISHTGSQVTVNLDRLSSVQQTWCWAHCGMALLASRNGAEVATDPFWFPNYALSSVPEKG